MSPGDTSSGRPSEVQRQKIVYKIECIDAVVDEKDGPASGVHRVALEAHSKKDDKYMVHKQPKPQDAHEFGHSLKALRLRLKQFGYGVNVLPPAGTALQRAFHDRLYVH